MTMTDNTTDIVTADPTILGHADQAALAICGMTRTDLYPALAGLDGYLPGEIEAAADALAAADQVAWSALERRREALEVLEGRLADAKRQLVNTASLLATGSCLRSVQTDRLGRAVCAAVDARQEAKTELCGHLHTAHRTLTESD
ncbi:hypothetical protein GCM10029992_36660 [Glycomyces albus]